MRILPGQVYFSVRRMEYPTETELMPGRGVEWFAGQIPSPVRRLRFLREFAPGPPTMVRSGVRWSWLRAAMPAVLLLGTIPTRPPAAHVSDAGAPLEKAAIPAVARMKPESVYVAPASAIWVVEKTDASETYSNGLRIDNRFSVGNHARSYLAFPAAAPEHGAERHSEPAGIVFHTTESLLAPFEPGENSRLTKIGESLVEYVKRRRSYNFLIDRFGRVFRVVREEDAANHAGYSVWSDASYIYLNLNESFLGVAFETQTLPAQDEAAVTPAQLHAAAMLTDMLRRRYRIRASNCVTHAQVSVNATNLQIGYHLDWASSFPFAQIGLPDNYAVPLPAVSEFGFEYDTGFARRAGRRMYQEAELGDREMRERAAAARVETAVYRRRLQNRYRSELAAMRDGVSAE